MNKGLLILKRGLFALCCLSLLILVPGCRNGKNNTTTSRRSARMNKAPRSTRTVSSSRRVQRTARTRVVSSNGGSRSSRIVRGNKMSNRGNVTTQRNNAESYEPMTEEDNSVNEMPDEKENVTVVDEEEMA